MRYNFLKKIYIFILILFVFIIQNCGEKNYMKKKLKPIDNKHVFDKAEWHEKSVLEEGQDLEQSFVHTGLFFAWLINNNMISNEFLKETSSPILEDFRNRKLSPSYLYKDWDGVLKGEMLTEEGYNFTLSYYESPGTYLDDYYDKAFIANNGKLFNIMDTWENYDKLKPFIDEAYKHWRK